MVLEELTLTRKLIQCFLDLSNFDAALGVFQHMSTSRKNHHLSRFLWYSLALRRKDDSSGMPLIVYVPMIPTDLFSAICSRGACLSS